MPPAAPYRQLWSTGMIAKQPGPAAGKPAAGTFDLDAARAVGFRTALVRRPAEWGDASEDQPEHPQIGTYDVEVDNFVELARVIR